MEMRNLSLATFALSFVNTNSSPVLQSSTQCSSTSTHPLSKFEYEYLQLEYEYSSTFYFLRQLDMLEKNSYF